MNSRLPLIDVMIISKKLCEDMTHEEHSLVHLLIKLNDGGELRHFVVVGACVSEDQEITEKKILENEGRKKEEIEFPDHFCHITTFDADIRKREISFDNEDDWPIKANFNSEFLAHNYFFKRFINFRNGLIENNLVVKSDDIYQYYESLTGFKRTRKK